MSFGELQEEVTPVSKESLAVVLVDMQPYFTAHLLGEVMQKTVREQERIIRACVAEDMPLIVLEYEGCGKTIESLEEEIRKVPRVTVINKGWDDGFRGTNLDAVLTCLGATSLLFMGINGNACVFGTARSAVRLGYKIFTSENLIADGQSASLWSIKESREWYVLNGVFCERPIVFV